MKEALVFGSIEHVDGGIKGRFGIMGNFGRLSSEMVDFWWLSYVMDEECFVVISQGESCLFQ